MSEDETAVILEELKKKYPNLTEEQLLDIYETGMRKAMESQGETTEERPPAPELAPGFDLVKALKGGEISIGEAIVLDGYLERKTGKSVRDEIIALQRETKGGKESGTDLDRILSEQMKYDLLESFMEARRERARAKTQPQTTKEVDIEKVIREIGDKMAEALKTHKLEDEKARMEEKANFYEAKATETEKKLTEHLKDEEEERKIQKKVFEPISKQVEEKIREVKKELFERLPEKDRKDFISSVIDEVEADLKTEIKTTITNRLLGKEEDEEAGKVATTSTGTVDWGQEAVKFGNRVIRILDNMAKRFPPPGYKPEKKEMKEMPSIPTKKEQPPPPLPKPAEEEQAQKPPSPPPETLKAAEQPKKPEAPKLFRETTPPAPKLEATEAETPKPLKEETSETKAEKDESNAEERAEQPKPTESEPATSSKPPSKSSRKPKPRQTD